jgi:peptide-methionine (S)-S-oxide reductase
MANQTAVLGGGCFWCLEAVFLEVRGVLAVESGYTGGHLPDPSYQQVCEGTTGHAEVVRIEFDDSQISFADLLEIFFAIHDPTTLNRQGHDVGTQYRSVIYWTDETQRDIAQATIAALGRDEVYGRDPIVTELTRLGRYYPGEAYHQRYFERNPGQGYCRMVVAPKVAKFRARLAERFGR